MNWRDYEKQIYELLLQSYPEADIQFDAKIEGRYTKRKRQVDISIEDYVAGNRIRIVIDAKYFGKNVDVKAVESFVGMLADVDAHKGLMITQKGYSESAIQRAHNGPESIELDILNLDELKNYQTFGAIPYAGNHGVMLSAPFGWVIDIHTTPQWLALMYQRGLDLETAQSRYEWIYIQFWDRMENEYDLDALMSIQESNIKHFDKKAKISYRQSIKRADGKTLIRTAEMTRYPALEIAGFIEFEKFIFFCVLFTPKAVSNRNIRKLENVLRLVRPMAISHESR